MNRATFDERRKKLAGLSDDQLRRAAQHRLRPLPPGKLRVAAEFLIFLETSVGDEATAELLRIPGLAEDVRKAHRDIAAGRGVAWRKVRRDV